MSLKEAPKDAHISQGSYIVSSDFFKVNDVGESMFVHVFGAYFGLALARVIYDKNVEDNDKNGEVYHSDLFAMIGE
jgi:ammonium transporter Rh